MRALLIGLSCLVAACGGGESTPDALPFDDSTSAETTSAALSGSETATAPSDDASTIDDAVTVDPTSIDPSEIDPANPPDGVPPMELINATFEKFSTCLRDNGVAVGTDLTIDDLIARAASMPIPESRAQVFGFLLETEVDDDFQAAVSACSSIIDEQPTLAVFMPPE